MTPTHALDQDQAGPAPARAAADPGPEQPESLTTAPRRRAKADASSGKVDLTRISVASLPTYPSAPKRYLFLLLGLLVGGLAGGGLTWLARRRKPSGDADDDDDLDPHDRELLDSDVDLRSQELNGAGTREPVGAGPDRRPAGPAASGGSVAAGTGWAACSAPARHHPAHDRPPDADLTDPDQQ